MLMRLDPSVAEDANRPPAWPRRPAARAPRGPFASLDASIREEVEARSTRLARLLDDRVYRRGDREGLVFTVRSGLVRFEQVTERGDRCIVRVAGPGDLIGLEALLDRPYAHDAVACADLVLLATPASVLRPLAERRPALLQALMSRWQASVEEAEQWRVDLMTGPARRRVLLMLSMLGRYADDDGRIWLPRREEMADMLDMAFETASRVLSRLRKERVIEMPGGRSTRVDAELLQEALAAE